MADSIDLENVLTLQTSETYHFKSLSDRFRRDKDEPACGLSNDGSVTADFRERNIDDVREEGKTYCSKCKRWLKRTSDVDIHECQVCGNLNIISPYEFMSLDVESEPTSNDKAYVCLYCILDLQKEV